MKSEKDRQQAVKLLLYLAEIAVLTAAVFLVVRFLPGGDRPWNRPMNRLILSLRRISTISRL